MIKLVTLLKENTQKELDKSFGNMSKEKLQYYLDFYNRILSKKDPNKPSNQENTKNIILYLTKKINNFVEPKIDSKNNSYDFGGSTPYQEDPNVIIVDTHKNNEYNNPFIKADLSNPIKLEPVKFIYSRGTVKYIPENKIKIFAQNINNALLPNGKVNLREDYSNGLEANKLLIKILQEMGFKIIKSNLDKINPKKEIIELQIILQKQ